MASNLTISAAELRESAARIRALRQRATEHAIEIGRELLRIKASLPHGAFVKWVEKECDFKIRTAQDLMKLAREGVSNAPPAALLVPSTLRLFVSKTTPEPVRQLVLDKLERGERVSRNALSAAVFEANGQGRRKHRPRGEDNAEAAVTTALAGPHGGMDTENERAKKIAQLLMQRLSEQDYEAIMSEINWGIWNRVLVWLRVAGTRSDLRRISAYDGTAKPDGADHQAA